MYMKRALESRPGWQIQMHSLLPGMHNVVEKITDRRSHITDHLPDGETKFLCKIEQTIMPCQHEETNNSQDDDKSPVGCSFRLALYQRISQVGHDRYIISKAPEGLQF